jgi:hypothetical protein
LYYTSRKNIDTLSARRTHLVLESFEPQEGAPDPVGRITVDTDDHQAFALHTTDKKPHGDTSETPTGQSATYTRFKTADADWGPWQREAY